MAGVDWIQLEAHTFTISALFRAVPIMTEERHARDANIFLTAEGLTTSPCMDKDPAGEYSHDTQTPNSKVVP